MPRSHLRHGDIFERVLAELNQILERNLNIFWVVCNPSFCFSFFELQAPVNPLCISIFIYILKKGRVLPCRLPKKKRSLTPEENFKLAQRSELANKKEGIFYRRSLVIWCAGASKTDYKMTFSFFWRIGGSMSMPMLAAVPAMILIADSILLQFKSGNFSWAIVRTWSAVTFPTFCRWGSFEPFSMPNNEDG